MLTTPFEYVPSCTNTPVTTTSLVSKFYWAETTTTLQVTAPDEGDDRFSSCQPPGWDSGPTESPFSFSPAVCPSGWTAYSLSTTLSTITIAYCCDSGYTLDWPIGELSVNNIVSPACFREVTATTPPPAQTTTTDTGSELMFSGGMEARNAWRIAWQSSDMAALSPTPPQLTCREPLAKWVPGNPAKQVCSREPEESSNSSSSKWSKPLLDFIMIGVPILGVAVLVCIGVCCWRACREGRRDRQARKAYERRAASQEG